MDIGSTGYGSGGCIKRRSDRVATGRAWTTRTPAPCATVQLLRTAIRGSDPHVLGVVDGLFEQFYDVVVVQGVADVAT